MAGTRGIWLLLAAALSGCGGRAEGPPEIVVDRDACSHCGMLISEPMYAAAARTDGSAPRVFDDIGCLRHAVRGERGPITSWFHDADGGGWIDGGGAIFVASPEIRSPMNCSVRDEVWLI